jgi:ribosomal-protein-serine acetyltransferase
MSASDHEAIDAVVHAFFGLFTNTGGAEPNLRAIFDLCIPEAIISKCIATPEVMSLEAFIAPRATILTDGTLTGFRETETAHRTSVLGNVAQRASTYAKSGVLRGAPFEQRGVKVFQLVRTPAGWRISAVAWDDERVGVTFEPAMLDEVRAG